MANIFDFLKTSPTDLLLTASGTFLITATLPEPPMYFERLTITYGEDGDIDNGNQISERK